MNAPSTIKVFLLVVLAALFGSLLFGQENEADENSSPAAPESAESAETTPEEPEEEASPAPAADKPEAEPAGEAQPEAAPSHAPATPDTGKEDRQVGRQSIIASLTIFVLALFVGFEVITKVPPTLHTPLMSGSNAISGITLVGAVIVAASMSFSGFIGFLAVTLATINVVGGFMVTHRMLSMFKKR